MSPAIRLLQYSRFWSVILPRCRTSSPWRKGGSPDAYLNTSLIDALVEYSKWYTNRFGILQADWYVFAFGKPWPQYPTSPVVSLKTAWRNVRTKANVQGRWHDNRHTFITGLAESGEAGDEWIRDMAGHVSKQMLKLPLPYRHGSQEAGSSIAGTKKGGSW